VYFVQIWVFMGSPTVTKLSGAGAFHRVHTGLYACDIAAHTPFHKLVMADISSNRCNQYAACAFARCLHLGRLTCHLHLGEERCSQHWRCQGSDVRMTTCVCSPGGMKLPGTGSAENGVRDLRRQTYTSTHLSWRSLACSGTCIFCLLQCSIVAPLCDGAFIRGFQGSTSAMTGS
jgi:hypothetical protein